MVACSIIHIVLVTCLLCANGAGQNCVLGCQTCVGKPNVFGNSEANPWYDQDENQTCGRRNELEPEFYSWDISCRIKESTEIRDPESCQRVLKDTATEAEFFWGKISTSFDNKTGCRVSVTNASWIGLERLDAKVCFGVSHPMIVIVTQIGAIFLGMILGMLGNCTLRNPRDRELPAHVEDYNTRLLHNPLRKTNWKVLEPLGPGSRKVAKNTLAPFRRRFYIAIFRGLQVIANLWLPMTMLWYFNPVIVASLWVGLYAIPAFLSSGFQVLQEPRLFITQGKISLLGIDTGEHQLPGGYHYMFEFIRPPIMITLGVWLSRLVIHISGYWGADNEVQAIAALNPNAYMKLADQNSSGHTLTLTVLAVTSVGTLGYMLMILPPMMVSLCECLEREKTDNVWLCRGLYTWVAFDVDPDFTRKFDEKAFEVMVAGYQDLSDDKDRVADLNVATISKNSAMISLGMACIDFGSYIYKIITFIRCDNYYLAAWMSMSCAEAIFTLWYRDHFAHAKRAFTNTHVSGIPAIHFLALCQWDDGMAGIPALALSVYGLPLARPAWYSAIISFFFLMTGTRALALYLADLTDAAMYEIEDPDDEEDSDEEGDSSDSESLLSARSPEIQLRY